MPYGAVGEVELTEYGSVRHLANCEYFTTDIISLNGKTDIKANQSFVSLIVLEGEISVKFGLEKISAKKGDSILYLHLKKCRFAEVQSFFIAMYKL